MSVYGDQTEHTHTQTPGSRDLVRWAASMSLRMLFSCFVRTVLHQLGTSRLAEKNISYTEELLCSKRRATKLLDKSLASQRQKIGTVDTLRL